MLLLMIGFFVDTKVKAEGYDNISIKSPANETAFLKSDPVDFSWEAPVPFPDGKSIFYHMRIVKIDKDQIPEHALLENPVWFEIVTTPMAPSSAVNGFGFQLKVPLDILSNYAWQVIAYYTENEVDYEVGRSSIYTFKGPPLLEQFNAGMHLVKVISTSNTDLADLSGTAEIHWGKEEPLTVQFEHLQIKQVIDGRMVLNSGEIIHNFEIENSILLNPDKTENGNAYFVYDKLRLNRDEMALQGNISWNMPHAPASSNKVQTKQSWIHVKEGNFQLLGNVPFAENNIFDLTDPQGFSLKADIRSDFQIRDNKYLLRFGGKILLPESISTFDSERVALSFYNVNQLSYLPNLVLPEVHQIRLVDNAGLVLVPKKITIDLSNAESPGKLASINNWKGVYFEEYDMLLYQDIDTYGNKMRIPEDMKYSVIPELNDGYRQWADHLGMNFTYENTWVINDRATVGAYSSTLKQINLSIEAGTATQSYLQGKTFIPGYNGQDSLNYRITINQHGLGDIHLFENEETMVLLEEPYLIAPQLVSHKDLTLRWFRVKDALHYIVDISNDNFVTNLDGYSNLIVSDTSLLVTGLAANSNYQIKVKAVYTDGEHTTSLIIDQKTSPLPSPPNAPLSLINTFDRSVNGVILQWQDASDNEEGFIIERSGGNQEAFTELAIVGADETSYLDKTTEAGSYLYRILAFNDGGKSAFSQTSRIITSTSQDFVSRITVFPNPARETIKVSSFKKIEKAVIYDMTGKKQLEFVQDFDNMRVKTLLAGVYILHLQFADRHVQMVKVLIE